MKKAKARRKNGQSESKEKQVRPIQQRIALLDSLDNLLDAKIRLEACATISQKFEPLQKEDLQLYNELRKELVKLGREGMFRSLVRCVNDTDSLVRINAIGALRNIAIIGNEHSISSMQQEDAWSALEKVIQDGDSNVLINSNLKKEALRVMEIMCEGSPAIAERRLLDSIPLIKQCLQDVDTEIVEAVSKLLYTATHGNFPLAKVILTSADGKELGFLLEKIASDIIKVFENEQLLSDAYCFGTIINLSVVSEYSQLPHLLTKLFSLVGNLLTETMLPHVLLNTKIISDTMIYEKEELTEEDLLVKKESNDMKRWLDICQAQAIIFDSLGDLLRKVDSLRDESDGNSEFWQSSIKPLEIGGLLPASLTFCMSTNLAEELSFPKALLVPLQHLRTSASECAASGVDIFISVDPSLLKETWQRILQLITELNKYTNLLDEVRDRLIASMNLLFATIRKASYSLASNFDISELLNYLSTCKVDEVRALVPGILERLVQLDPSSLQSISKSLIQFMIMNKETNLVVIAEIVDVLINLFSDDETKDLFDSMNGLQVFQDFLKSFDSKFSLLKRNDYVNLDEELSDKIFGVKSNVEAYLRWRNTS